VSFSVVHTEKTTMRAQPCSTATVSERQASCEESGTCGEDGDDDDIASQRTDSQEQDSTLEEFRRPDSETEDVPSLHQDTSSNATPSVASWSSKSNNPFHQSMEIPWWKVDVAQGLAGFSQNIWDDPISANLID
jgi:hypothetical protein